MFPTQEAFMTTESFRFEMPAKDLVNFSFGATQVTMSLDATYDLQYRLASFLAQIELMDYPTFEDERLAESRAALETFALLPSKGKRLDS